MSSKFYNKIKNAKIEREVEDVYNEGISLYFLKNENIQIEHPYDCDGYVEKDLFLRLLIEYKFDEFLANSVARAKVLVQVLYYLKKFELNGNKLPNVIMVGDKNEVFVMHTNPLLDYLDENIDWKIAPSSAPEKNPELISKIAKDNKINPFVWVIDDNFSFKEVADKINDLAKNVKRRVRITEHNISVIFDYFCNKVLKNANKIAPNDLVGYFIGAIIDKINYYKHPNNPNILVCRNTQVQIDGRTFDSFFSHFEKDYSPKEKQKFTEIADRLIEDTKRRRSGEFYTPTPFVDYAHKMISEELGEDWKEKYVVWDCCWGTGNLTRDYQFKELYASTLEQAELDCGARYNQEATKFVFDFLNDDISNLFGSKLPPKLYEALEQNKPIVFFINPPYATASSNMGKGETQGKGKDACKTRIYDEMVNSKMSEASKNLFAQFIYRIHLIKKQFKLSDVHIAVFCTPIYLSGTTFLNFRKEFLKEFEYKGGILFNASCFADVSNKWGINFTIWKNGETLDKYNFLHKLIEENAEGLNIFGSKMIYNTDGITTAKDWIKEPLLNIMIEKVKKPTLSTGINVKIGNHTNTQIDKNALGCYLNVGNDIYNSALKVALFTSCDSSNANGLSVMPENFNRVVSIFSARRLVIGTWINDKDTFLIPNIHHEKWQDFLNDSIVYSLFQSASQQSSLRNIEYENKIWNIKNEFFWMSKNKIMELANQNNFDFTYNDAKASNERFVYNKLQEISLSKEAQAVLDKAIELTIKSFPSREIFNQEHPEYQIMNWDCGWYQIKGLLKEYYKGDLEEFSKLYKVLADKMRPMVYELGFLK